jgi:acyl-CoA reductase-like NAD-dependent aldehyde dehydrogenase
MTTPARRLALAATPWQATDPVLAALRAARARRDQADRDIRILLAYARELTTPRPYRLADLAEATGKSISGIRTAYTTADIDAARYIVHDINGAHDAAERPGDGSHDLRHPPRRLRFLCQEAVDI